MKSILSFLTFFIPIILFGQSNFTYKIDYKFLVDEKLLEMYESTLDDVQSTLRQTAIFALAMQGDSSISQVWVNKDFVRAKSNLFTDHYEIINKNNKTRQFVYPSNAQYYMINSEDSIASEDDDVKFDDYEVEFIDNQTKQIAGYTCKLARIDLSSEMEEVSIEIWYTDELPSLYWGEYTYLEKIPGATLEISTYGLGIGATEVQKITNDATVFAIPANFELIAAPIEETSTWVEDTQKVSEYELGDNRIAFLDEDGDLYGIKDSEGNIITPPAYAYIQEFDDNLAVVIDNDSYYGIIDYNGKIIIPVEYDYLVYNNNDRSVNFSKDGKQGIMDLNKKIIIPAVYDYISTFNNDGFAVVSLHDKFGVINKNNKVVVDLKHSIITEAVGKNFITMEDDDIYALYDFNNKKKAQYPYIVSANHPNLFIAVKDDKFGYIDADGKVIIPIIYTYATPFDNGIAEVLPEGKDDLVKINIKGELIQE